MDYDKCFPIRNTDCWPSGVRCGLIARVGDRPGDAKPVRFTIGSAEKGGQNVMAERRIDRIERCLRAHRGRARLQQLLEEVRAEEDNPDLSYQCVYMAIQQANQRSGELGQRSRFITSRDGEDRGWIRLREESDFAQGSVARDLDAKIKEKNERVADEIRTWLQRMDWRTFESTFLTRILEALGFQDVQITQSTRDGGLDARVSYRRGIVEARAIVSAKRWTSRTVGVEEVRMLRGLGGNEDTAIVVTTGRFSPDAQEEAKPGQNQRIVILIDGEMLIDVCKRNQIGVKKVQLPELLILDPELTRTAEDAENESSEPASVAVPDDVSGVRRLRDEMLGDPEWGLSVEEVATLSGYALNTVRAYLADDRRRKWLGTKIRDDEQTRLRALEIVSQRRNLRDSE
jgi:restriction endonuclease Mrr